MAQMEKNDVQGLVKEVAYHQSQTMYTPPVDGSEIPRPTTWDGAETM